MRDCRSSRGRVVGQLHCYFLALYWPAELVEPSWLNAGAAWGGSRPAGGSWQRDTSFADARATTCSLSSRLLPNLVMLPREVRPRPAFNRASARAIGRANAATVN